MNSSGWIRGRIKLWNPIDKWGFVTPEVPFLDSPRNPDAFLHAQTLQNTAWPWNVRLVRHLLVEMKVMKSEKGYSVTDMRTLMEARMGTYDGANLSSTGYTNGKEPSMEVHERRSETNPDQVS